MDKGKAILILVMLCGLFGYGAYQQQAANAPPAPPTPPAGEQPPPDPAAKQFEGKPLPVTWNIGKAQWMNTAKPVAPGDLKGQVALIEFFRVECSHCQEAVPFMKDMQQMFGSHGLKIVAFQSPSDGSEKERDWKQVQSELRKWGVKYPVAFDAKRALFTRLGGKTFPTLLVIDRSGKVRLARSGHSSEEENEIRQTVGQLLSGMEPPGEENGKPPQ